MARKGLLGKNRPADLELSRVYDEVRDAFEKVAADHDVLSSPTVLAIDSMAVPAATAILNFTGGAGKILTLPPANAQGPSVGALLVVMNTSPSNLTVVPSRGDTVNGTTSLTVNAGTMRILASNGVGAWLST